MGRPAGLGPRVGCAFGESLRRSPLFGVRVFLGVGVMTRMWVFGLGWLAVGLGACGTTAHEVACDRSAMEAEAMRPLEVGTREFQLQGEHGPAVFELPVVAGSPVVAARINAELEPESLFGDSEEALRGSYAECSCGHVGASFRVLWQRQGVLSLAVDAETLGAYPSGYTILRNFDERTGVQLTIDDILLESGHWPVLEALNVQLAASVKDSIARALEDDPDAGQEVADYLAESTFVGAHLDAFVLTPEGIEFSWNAGMPRIMQMFEPDGPFRVSWAEVEPHLTARMKAILASR